MALEAGLGEIHYGPLVGGTVGMRGRKFALRRRDAHGVAEAEVAVVPSLYEGFSLPAIEAMACGTPALVSDETAGGCPEAGDLLPREPVAGPHRHREVREQRPVGPADGGLLDVDQDHAATPPRDKVAAGRELLP